jgi:hypothetical protein
MRARILDIRDGEIQARIRRMRDSCSTKMLRGSALKKRSDRKSIPARAHMIAAAKMRGLDGLPMEIQPMA